MTSERLSSNALLANERERAKKIYLDGFADEFDSGPDGLNYTEVMLILNSDADGAGICVKIVLLIVYLSECLFWFI